MIIEPTIDARQAELEGLDPVGYAGVNVTSAGLSAQYEKMWRISFVGSTVEGDVEAMQVVVGAGYPFPDHFCFSSDRPLRDICNFLRPIIV